MRSPDFALFARPDHFMVPPLSPYLPKALKLKILKWFSCVDAILAALWRCHLRFVRQRCSWPQDRLSGLSFLREFLTYDAIRALHHNQDKRAHRNAFTVQEIAEQIAVASSSPQGPSPPFFVCIKF